MSFERQYRHAGTGALVPPLTKAEFTVVDLLAELSQTKRTDVLKNALAVYSWFVRPAVTGSQVIPRKPTGEEVIRRTNVPPALFQHLLNRTQERKIP